MKNSFILKGDICYTPSPEKLIVKEHSFVVCENGICRGVYDHIPPEYVSFPLTDCGRHLLVPGLTDLHIHAPQFAFRGLGMDLELLEWLDTYAFPEESRYEDMPYAQKAYTRFADDLICGSTTRACIFATVHIPATMFLMDLMESSGLKTLTGRVNMDRNSPAGLCEKSAAQAVRDTKRWIQTVIARGYKNTAPILTPRFIPSCSDELMSALGELRIRYHLPVQSHLSENKKEIELVNRLCPDADFYADAYDRRGMFGRGSNTVMAHCVCSGGDELDLIKEQGVFIAHCPQSNTNLSSGIAPVRTFLDMGIPTGLGSDVAGGSSASIFRAMADAIQVSKLRFCLLDSSLAPLTLSEAFYLGTKGGGSFFGKTGSFEDGYEFDALELDDSQFSHPDELAPDKRLERLIYLAGDDRRIIVQKFVAGYPIHNMQYKKGDAGHERK